MNRTRLPAIVALAVALVAARHADAAIFAYVTNTDSVSVIDTQTNEVVTTIPAPPATGGDGLLGITIGPDGTTAYIGSFGSTLRLLDLSSRTFVGSLPTGGVPRKIAFSPTSPFAYVIDQARDLVLKIDSATWQVIRTIPVGRGPVSIGITDAVYVVNNATSSGSVSVIDLETDDVVATIPVGAYPNGLALHPFLPIAYVANQCGADCGSISVIDTRSRLVTSEIQTHRTNTQGVAFTPDGTAAYATNTASNSVSVIDVETGSVVGAPIAVGEAPAEIAFTPDGGFAYVINQAGSSSVINTTTRAVVATIPLGSHPAFVAIEGTVCRNDGAPCNDANPCTAADVCMDGACTGTPVVAPCNDVNPCTMADFCSDGVCTGTPVAAGTQCWSDGIDCTSDVCDGAGACGHPSAVEGTSCSTDGNVCTDDVCDAAGTCAHQPNTSPCDDGTGCTTADVCDNRTCRGTPLAAGTACPTSDGNPCTDDICDGAGTCAPRPNADACDDENACSSGDVCSAGTCVPTGVAPACQGPIDLTGTWALYPSIPIPYWPVGFLKVDAGAALFGGGSYYVDAVRLVQTGAVLSVQTASQPDVVLYPHRPGSVNPATGQFVVSFDVTLPDSVGSAIEIHGTASPSGETFTAIARVYSPYYSIDYDVAGLNQCAAGPCCGDGVVDPGEACDGPCCDATCSILLPAGTCSSVCGGTCDGAGNCVEGPCCGNGVIESGEACDGPCCDATCSAPLPPAPGPCARPCGAGDCDGDGSATIAELVSGVNIALGYAPVDVCPPFDGNGDARVTVDELIAAVSGALNGCGG